MPGSLLEVILRGPYSQVIRDIAELAPVIQDPKALKDKVGPAQWAAAAEAGGWTEAAGWVVGLLGGMML
jgi:hypothetical protein